MKEYKKDSIAKSKGAGHKPPYSHKTSKAPAKKEMTWKMILVHKVIRSDSQTDLKTCFLSKENFFITK